MSFFENLFGKAVKLITNIDWSLILDNPPIDLSKLIGEFSVEEIKQAVFFFFLMATKLQAWMDSHFPSSKDFGLLFVKICMYCWTFLMTDWI